MSEINFYQTDDAVSNSISPLLLKILKEKKRVIIFCNDLAQMKIVDNSLWSYGKNKFIPHVTIFDKEYDFERQPIILTNEEKNINNADYLIFLNEPSKDFIFSFDRIFYFFEEKQSSEAQKISQNLNPQKSYKKESGKWVINQFTN